MVKIVRDKTLENYEARQKELSDTNKKLEETVQQLMEQNQHMDSVIQDLQSKIDAFADENTLTLKVSDDLTHVVPIIRVKHQVFEKMVELGYLDDTVNSETKAFSMQLALMHVCYEALEQIIESFSANIEE